MRHGGVDGSENGLRYVLVLGFDPEDLNFWQVFCARQIDGGFGELERPLDARDLGDKTFADGGGYGSVLVEHLLGHSATKLRGRRPVEELCDWNARHAGSTTVMKAMSSKSSRAEMVCARAVVGPTVNRLSRSFFSVTSIMEAMAWVSWSE